MKLRFFFHLQRNYTNVYTVLDVVHIVEIVAGKTTLDI